MHLQNCQLHPAHSCTLHHGCPVPILRKAISHNSPSILMLAGLGPRCRRRPGAPYCTGPPPVPASTPPLCGAQPPAAPSPSSQHRQWCTGLTVHRFPAYDQVCQAACIRNLGRQASAQSTSQMWCHHPLHCRHPLYLPAAAHLMRYATCLPAPLRRRDHSPSTCCSSTTSRDGRAPATRTPPAALCHYPLHQSWLKTASELAASELAVALHFQCLYGLADCPPTDCLVWHLITDVSRPTACCH